MKGDFKHLRAVIEREIVLRSAKHVCKTYLRDQLTFSTLHVAQSVAHLFNLLLCPTPFLHNLNNSNVKFTDETVQSQFQ
jgi:Translation initiation factor eIF3 subunit 135